MKKFLILITFISSLIITKSIAETTDLAVDVDSGKIWVYSVDRSTGSTTLLNSNTIDGGSVSFGASYLDSEGNMFFKGQSNYLIYNYPSNTFTGTRPLVTGTVGGSATIFEVKNIDSNGNAIITSGTDAEDNSSTTILGSLDISDSNGNTLIEQDTTGTTIEIGENSSGETGLIISNTSAALDIQDGSGNTMIKVTSDGATHIGENSLVTQEVNGRQQLYATDATGNRIDINIPSGTNLLIDGEDVMGSIDSSIALGAAFASLPTGAEGAGYTCGLGTGFHDSASAISGGCGFDFANYSFVDTMPELFQKASFNIGAASVVHGEGDDATLKAGITFKFGAPKPVREARDDNLLLENKIDAVMAENDLLKAQIAEINTQLKALNMLAMN